MVHVLLWLHSGRTAADAAPEKGVQPVLSAKKISTLVALATILTLPAMMGATGCAGGAAGDLSLIHI